MLAFTIGLVIGIVLGNVGLLAYLAWLDVTGDTRNVTTPLQRAEGHVDALAEDARGTLARCSDMHPHAYNARRDRRAGDRPGSNPPAPGNRPPPQKNPPQHSGTGGAA